MWGRPRHDGGAGAYATYGATPLNSGPGPPYAWGLPALPVMTLRNVLVPTDLSSAAERAFVPAAELAVHHGATVTVVQVTAEPSAPASGTVTRVDGPEVGDQAFELVPVVDVEVEASDVAAAIVEQARRTDADLIVMGTHGRSGLSRLRLGSVAEAVTRAAPCPVLLVRTEADLDGWRLRRVLAAVDPNDLDTSADLVPAQAQRAADLAASFGAHLDLLAVAERSPDRGYPSLRRCAASLLSITVRLARRPSAPARVDYIVRQGDPVDAIVAEAERTEADLVVVGTRRRGLRRLVLGSVAEGVARRSPCPVLVVLPDRASSVRQLDEEPVALAQA